jgi:membrane-bound serine protease (ClpP class)
MDFLLDPNVAYLVLAGGVSLALLSVITPGTGILEITALFLLLLSGYALVTLPLNYWAVAVLLVGIVLFILSIRKARSLPLLALSILALVVGSVYIFKGDSFLEPAVNPFLAIVVSCLTAGFFWVAATKYLEAERKRPAQDLKRLIGALGEAKTDIFSDGTVQVAGELWSARSQSQITAGSKVRILNRDGFVLEVEPVQSE